MGLTPRIFIWNKHVRDNAPRLSGPRSPLGSPPQHHLQPEYADIGMEVVGPTPSRSPGPCTPPQLPGPHSPLGSPHQHHLQPESTVMEVFGPMSSRSPGPHTPPRFPGPHTSPGSPPKCDLDPESADFDMDAADEGDSHVFPSTNMLANIQGVYGYALTMGGTVTAEDLISWDSIPPTLGFSSLASFSGIADHEQSGIRLFVHCLLKDPEDLPVDRDDLNDCNFTSLSMLFNW